MLELVLSQNTDREIHRASLTIENELCPCNFCVREPRSRHPSCLICTCNLLITTCTLDNVNLRSWSVDKGSTCSIFLGLSRDNYPLPSCLLKTECWQTSLGEVDIPLSFLFLTYLKFPGFSESSDPWTCLSSSDFLIFMRVIWNTCVIPNLIGSLFHFSQDFRK